VRAYAQAIEQWAAHGLGVKVILMAYRDAVDMARTKLDRNSRPHQGVARLERNHPGHFCWQVPVQSLKRLAQLPPHHQDLVRREHSKVTAISGTKLLGPEAAAPKAGGGSWVDAGCWTDGCIWAGGGGSLASVDSSVHFARKLPLLRK
jgi:hypothetical protein